MEPAADLVVDAARRHPLQRVDGHLQGALVAGAPVVAEQQPDRQAGRELGRAADAAVLRVLDAIVEGDRRADRLRPGDAGARRRAGHGAPDGLGDRLGRPGHALRVAPVDLGQVAEQRGEPLRGAAIAVVRREVGPPEERPPVGVEPDAHGPAAVPGERLDGAHVDRVDVGPLLAVHLDGDEVLVQEPRDLQVLEGLLLHHVAPVAGGVAHREEDRAAGAPGLVEGLVAPGAPVHRVVRVLAEVGARLQEEAVREVRDGAVSVPRARDPAGRCGRERLAEACGEVVGKGSGAGGGEHPFRITRPVSGIEGYPPGGSPPAPVAAPARLASRSRRRARR